MATGSGPLGANIAEGKVTLLTPTVDIPSNTHLWDALSESARRFDAVIERGLTERAKAKGAQEGMDIAAGRREYKPASFFSQMTDVGVAREEARRTGYLTGARNQIDTREKALRDTHLYDPDVYKAETSKMVSEFIQAAPPEYAVEVEAYAGNRITNGLEVVTTARRGKDEREAAATITARQESLTARLKDLAALPGGEHSPEFGQIDAELQGLLQQKVTNPLFAYTPEQAALEGEKLNDELGGIFVSRDTLHAYASAGGGMPGYAAAKRWLSDEFMNGESFKDLPADRRARYARDATRNLDAAFAGDRAQRQLEAQDREAEERKRREHKEAVLLDVLTGGASEADILADDLLDDGDQATLIRAARSERSRQRTEANREARLANLENKAAYKDLYGDAERGVLNDGDLATSVQGGFVSKAQADTLRSLNTRANKYDMDLLTKDAKAAIDGRPGWSKPRKAAAKAEVDEIAVSVIRKTPDADEAGRERQAKVITQRYRPAASGAASSQSARLRALDDRLKKKLISPAAYRRQRQQILNGE